MDLFIHAVCDERRSAVALGPRGRVERPLSAARKASVDQQDPVETACRVRQAIQRENEPVQSPELFSRNTVRPPTLYIGLGH